MKKVTVWLAAFALILGCMSLGVAGQSEGEKLYQSCSGCHGQNGEKLALGVGQPLKGQTANQILEKLNGYADGSYGGSKKSVMTGIAKRMGEEDRVSVSEFISKF